MDTPDPGQQYSFVIGCERPSPSMAIVLIQKTVGIFKKQWISMVIGNDHLPNRHQLMQIADD